MNRKAIRFFSRFTSLALSLAAVVIASAAYSGGVHDIPLTSIPQVRSPITVDGSLADWPDTHPVVFTPLDPGLAQAVSPAEKAAVAQLRRASPSAELQACYDSRALYFAVIWKGAGQRSGALTLHIQTDHVTHLSLTPKAAGLKRFTCAVAVNSDGTATEEIRIPWTALTASGKAPSALTLAADLEWPQVTAALIRQLPATVRHDNTHLTACFLTSPSKLFGRDAYLGRPSDWGDLKFVSGQRPNATQISALATGATVAYVPHVSAPLPINGSLSGWKPTQFQTAAYAPGLLGSRYSARLAAFYDAHFLYLAAHFQSPGGPLNTEPEATQAGYAGGDCLQVRLNDGQHTVNLCGWYDSTGKKPALTADGNDLKNPYLLRQGAKEAFRTDADGLGYTQVIAVPWAVLPGGTAPHAGDTWKGSFQVWWAGLNPQFTVLASAALSSGGGIPYAYSLPAESNVTLGIFDAQGHLIRSLVKDVHRRAGRSTEYWDGKDQFGAFVAPGKYQVRGLDHPPISVTPVVSLGNPGSPPWPTADGRGDWLSDEAAPQGAVADGTNVYLAAPGSEKGSAIIAVGPDGKRLWGHQESVSPRCVSLTLAGQYLYALFSGPESVHASAGEPDKIERAFIVCLDKTTGAPALFSAQKNELRIAEWPYVDRVAGLWDLRAHQSFTPLRYGGQPRYFANDLGEPTEAVGVAAAHNRLYVSMLTENRLLVLDSASGKPLDTISVPQPVGLRALPDGKLLAVSGGKVVMIDPSAKTITTIIDHELAAPHDVTTDKLGNIYVSDWANSFQVKVFSPSGKLLRAIGVSGGRPWIGQWNPNGMLLPRGLAVTDDGKLWVAEDDASPNRVSVWNAATGAFIRDYLGPSPYGGGALVWADPKDSTTVVAEGTVFHVDYAKKTWTPVATPFRRLSGAAPFTPTGMSGGFPGTRTIVHDGKQYVFCSLDDYNIVVLRRDGNLLTPVAAVGSRGRFITGDGTQKSIWDSDIGDHRVAGFYPDFFQGHSGDNFVWTDKNGDGLVQPDEMQWVHTLGRGDTYTPGLLPEITVGWGFGIGPDGALYLGGQTKDSTTVSRLDLQGWSPSGAPLYDLAAAKPIITGDYPGGVHGLYADDSGHLLVTRGYEWNPGKHHALDCYTRDGKLLWSFNAPEGRQLADDFLADNVIAEFHEPSGENILASWLWHADFKPYLFTDDGLYVGSLLDDTKLGPTATWDESYKNYFQSPDGSAYIVNGANDTYHIGKINGIDHLRRFTGTITVSQADLQAVASAKAAPATPAAPPPIVRVAWLKAPPAIDGSLADWDRSEAVALTGSKGRTARVALGRDANTLYLAYEIHGAKLVNKGGNWQTLFISGDCVDLMLHIGPFTPHFAPAEGDERLLLSVYQGKPVAVLYRPVVPGSMSPTRLMAATIDQIVRLDAAKIAYQRTRDGYTLEASVPLADLGIGADPADGAALCGDVGVIYADETGADRALRLYYYNHETDMTADLTTEATLQPGNWGEIAFPMGPNLVKNGGFEQPLAASFDWGWAVTTAQNGGSATFGSPGETGVHALLMQQITPVTYPPESYHLQDYGAFIHSANGGKGGGYTEVSQRVPVTAGKKYTLRFHFRTQDFPGGENKDPGPNRGYVSLQSWIAWEGAGGGIWVVNHQDTTHEWKTLTNARFNDYGPAMPYTAPAGAMAAVIKFSLSDNFAQRLPKAWVDDVEFVEAP